MYTLFALLIVFISALLQGMTSFGASLIAMPLLLLFYDIKVVVPLLISFNLVMNLILFRQLYKHLNMKEILPLLIPALVFTVIGIVYLKSVDPSIIKLVIGFILLVLSLTKLFGFKFQFKGSLKSYIPVGIISGLLNGMAGLSGPPVLILLSGKDVDKTTFRTTLTSYFLFLNFFTVGSLLMSRQYTIDVFNHFMVLIPALLIGLISGIYLGNKVNEEIFKKLILIFLGLMGSYMIIQSF